MKKYTIIYFSPTGNTRYLAIEMKRLLNDIDTSILALEKVNMLDIQKTEELILMYPIHGFNAPRTVKRFVKELPKGLFEKIHLIAVGCNNLWLNDAVSTDLRKELNNKSYQIYTDKILAMPLTFVMSFPNDVKEKTIADAEEELQFIVEEIRNSTITDRTIKFRSKVVNFVGGAESFAARFFGLELHAKSSCTSCGICWNNCPESNISKNKKGKPSFGFKCSMCMRCIYSCPEQSITPWVSKFLVIKDGYSIENKKS